MKKVFVSYSRKDAAAYQRLYDFLRPMIISGEIEVWSDSDILPGENWKEALSRSMEDANVFVMLISPSYMRSDFLANSEIPLILSRAKNRESRLFPVVIEPVALPETPLKGYPVMDVQDLGLDDTFLSVASAIKSIPSQPARISSVGADLHADSFLNAAKKCAVSPSFNVQGGRNIFIEGEARVKGSSGAR